MSVRQGTRLGGRYVLTERLATGGMGEVWSGRDEVLGRVVAVKILRPELSEDDAFRRRFRAEARTASSLSHPGIAQVFDYGEAITLPSTPPSGRSGAAGPSGASGAAVGGRRELRAAAQVAQPFTDGGGVAYLVMELLPGEPLSALITATGGIGSDRTLAVVAQAARALHAAHLKGVIHRDVKPANLMVSPDSSVKVTDFGIARPQDHEPLTATGQVMGTAHYLAPELARGETASPLSDVYALGVVAYECLAGHRPFDGDNQVAVATAHLSQPPPPLPETIPLKVRAVVGAAMAKVKTERIPSAAAFADALEALRLRDTIEGTAATPAVTAALRELTAAGRASGVDGLVAAPAPVPTTLPPPPGSPGNGPPGSGGTGNGVPSGSRTSSDPTVRGTAQLDLAALQSAARNRALGGGSVFPAPPPGAGTGGIGGAGHPVAADLGQLGAGSSQTSYGQTSYGPDGEDAAARRRRTVLAASAAAAVLVIAGGLTAMALMHSSDNAVPTPSSTPSTASVTPSTPAPFTPNGSLGPTRTTPHHTPSRTTPRTSSTSPTPSRTTPTATTTPPPTSTGPTTSPSGSGSPSGTPSDSGSTSVPPSSSAPIDSTSTAPVAAVP